MHISAEIVWLILALVAGGVEMMTGTVFLLVVALALVFGALTAWLGGTFTWQLVVVALITVVGSLWVFKRRKAQEKTDGLAQPDVGRTVGQRRRERRGVLSRDHMACGGTDWALESWVLANPCLRRSASYFETTG